MNHRLGVCAKLFTSPAQRVKWAYWKKAFIKSVVLKAVFHFTENVRGTNVFPINTCALQFQWNPAEEIFTFRA